MTNGGVLLIDEISLAQDSVLERLNSVLEKEKTIVVSEKGDGTVQELVAHKNFMIIATMNPSGDYGKKELTPALRNRFTEIWVEPVTGSKILEEDRVSIDRVTSTKKINEVESISNDFINFVLKELRSLETAYKLADGRVTLSQGRNILVLILQSIVSNFNNNFGTVLKPLTVRDVKSTIPFFAKNLKTYEDLGLDLIKDYINLLLGGFKCQDKIMAEASIEDSFKLARDIFETFIPQSKSMNTEVI